VPRWLAPGLALLAVAWLLLLVAAPFLTAPVAAVLYAAGSLICHQLPERSFHLQDFQLPVCARCLGIYGGAAVGSVTGAAAVGRRVLVWWRQPAARSVNWMATAVAASPTLATFVLEWGFGWPISNAVRATAALPVGFAVAFVVVSALATLHYEECAQPRPIRSSQPPTST
jgi:hypothetical protein